MSLGNLMFTKTHYPAAIEHLSAAQKVFNSLGFRLPAAQCSEALDNIYLHQDNLDSAAAEMKAAHLIFIDLGVQQHVAQSTELLGIICILRGDLTWAEELFGEAETINRVRDNRSGLALCAHQLGVIRSDQGRRREAIIQFKSAQLLHEEV